METNKIIAIVVGVIMFFILGAIVILFLKKSREEDAQMSQETKEQRRREEIQTKKNILKGIFIFLYAIAVYAGWGMCKALLYSPSVPGRWWTIVGISVGEMVLGVLLSGLHRIIDKRYQEKENNNE